MTSRIWFCLPWLVVASLVLAPPLPSQQEAAEQGVPTYGDAVDVRVVSVDVFVTDKKGRRVSGLEREDFVVYQDGREVELTNFSPVSGRGRAPRSATVAPLQVSPDDRKAPTIDDPLTLVVYIDNATLTPPHRNRVLGDLEEFVREQGEGLRFMVAAFNPGLEILVEATRDPDEVVAALDRIAEMPARGLTAIGDRRRTMGMIEDVYKLYAEATVSGQVGETSGDGERGAAFDPCTIGWGQMIGAADTYALTATDRIGSSQAGLLGLVRSLGGIPGRKAVLYMSDGLEQRPGIDVYALLGELCPDREREMISYITRWDETGLLEELADYANSHRVTLYALETTGLRSASTSSVEMVDRRFTPSARNDSLRVSNLQSSLFIMADETGGQAFFNANFPAKELARMADDFYDYYSLGFVPPAGWDGVSHRIRVELAPGKSKGVKLRYRQRYRAIPDEERMAERTLAALVLGWEDNPLGSGIRIGEPAPGDDDTWEVPVEIVLPRGALGSRMGDAGERQLVRVLMIAEDERSRRTPMRERVIPIVYGAEGAVAQDDSSLIVNVTLESGVHTVAVGIRDELNRVTSYHREKIEIRAEQQVEAES